MALYVSIPYRHRRKLRIHCETNQKWRQFLVDAGICQKLSAAIIRNVVNRKLAMIQFFRGTRYQINGGAIARVAGDPSLTPVGCNIKYEHNPAMDSQLVRIKLKKPIMKTVEQLEALRQENSLFF